MNKKITAVTLTAIMVLTMFTAMVPAASAVEEVAAPYEFLGAVNTSSATEYFIISANSKDHPSLLFYDLDDKDGNETLDLFTLAGDKYSIGDRNMTYTTTLWNDSGYEYIAWLGDKYRKVPGEWVISKELVDEDEDDDHLLRVGETLNLPEGFAISASEIDVDGEEAWLSLTKDGEQIDDEVVSTKTGLDNTFVYEDDFDEADDVEIMKFTVETVFAGMNTNLVKINNISLVSMDLLEVEGGSDEPFNDYYTSFVGDDTIKIENDDDISLTKDGTEEIFDGRFIIRVNEDGDLAALAKEINIGGVTPTEAPTEVETEVPTEEPTNVTAVEPGVPTEGPTEVATEEVPTEATPEPGFEAVFAVAGLLAVAYLVLRQRE